MNYIWEVLFQAIAQNIEPDSIRIHPAKEYSAYMELAMDYLNDKEIFEGRIVEVNYQYRYDEIFAGFLDLLEELPFEQLKKEIFDIYAHIFFVIERYCGMSKLEFYKLFVSEAVGQNCFGENTAKAWGRLSIEEKSVISLNILLLYRTSGYLELFIESLKEIEPAASVYFYTQSKKEVIVYTSVRYNMELEEKIYMLRRLFLPIDYFLEIYWDRHFGIFDSDETMRLDTLELH